MRLVCLASLASLLAATACAPRYRQETLGTGTVVVGASLADSAAVAAPGAGGITITSAGDHRIDWSIATPRAMRLAWALDCGGVQQSGVAGETFEDYKVRRIAQIRAEREQQKKAISSAGGALLGTVGAGAHVETPDAQADATVAVDGEAVGGAVADQVISDDVQLPAGDVGAGSYGGTFMIATAGAGACTMSMAPEIDGADPTGVHAEFRVTRVVDLAVERAAERERVRGVAVEIRGELGARLVAHGADPELRVRLAAEAAARREAELVARAEALRIEDSVRVGRENVENAERTARIEAELRISADVDARARAEQDLRLRAQADAYARIAVTIATTRQAQLAYLVRVGGADPGHRERVRIEAEQAEARRRAELGMRGQLVIELRSRIAMQLIAYGADPDYRRKREEAAIAARAHADAIELERFEADRAARAELMAEVDRRAFVVAGVRADLMVYLRWLGAVERPPMPDPIDESWGEPPGAGAVWIAGEWNWQGAEWVWIAGGWGFNDDTFVDAEVTIGGGGRTIVVDHRDEPAPDPSRTITVDHRDPDPEPTRPKTRDHRDDDSDPAPRPKQRDHRDDDDDDDKPRPKTRDHRK